MIKTKYSEEDLKVFETLITTKLEKAYDQVENLQNQLIEMEESLEDDASSHNEGNFTEQVEFLNTMVYRQKKHINDLESALMRIKNKTYGRCSVTGALIDKDRLLAVPTTTKSIAGKQQLENGTLKEKKPIVGKPKNPIITTKIVKKTLAVKPPTNSDLVDKSIDFIDISDDDEYEDDSYDPVEDNHASDSGMWD